MPERWGDYIRDLKVLTLNGSEVVVVKSGNDWMLRGTQTGQRVRLSYRVMLSHERIDWPGGIDGVAYVRDWGIMTSGRSLFLMNGRDKAGIAVSFSKPDAWKVSAPWETADPSQNLYSVPSLSDLQESFIFAGTHEEIRFERPGFVLKFVLGGDSVLQEQSRYQQVAKGVLDYYIELLGGIPRPAPGLEFGQSMVIISASDSVDGEVVGNHISMFMNPEGDTMQQMMGWFMFAHEFFHLWNGKTLRFASTETDWFKEGVSNYYTMKALKQIGFADEQALLMMLDGLFYQRYIHDPGYGTLAPARAASGFSKDDHWGLIYGGGLFAGIAMDLEIRHQTANSRSLDDLMRGFYAAFGGTDKLIASRDILMSANQIGRTDFSALLGSGIEGTEPVPLSGYLEHAGVETDTETGHLILRHREGKSALEAAIWEGFLGGH